MTATCTASATINAAAIRQGMKRVAAAVPTSTGEMAAGSVRGRAAATQTSGVTSTSPVSKMASVWTMNSSQASARDTRARLVAVRGTGAAAVRLIDEVWDAGDAALPLDPDLPDGTARRIAEDLGAGALIEPGGHDTLAGDANFPPGTALVVRTSGTTAAPQGVVLSHAALRAGVEASVDRLDARSGARWLAVLPLHHIAGLLVVLRARMAGTPPIVHPRFDAARVAAETDVTHVALVPTMLYRLLEHGADVGRFHRILLGGAAASRDLRARATAAGARLTISYGMTETAGGCVYDGLPLDGMAVAVDPDGRVLLRGDVLADGYLVDGRTTRLTDDDGWFPTGDLGAFADGRLVVHGRADDVIVTGGVNVSTTAVAEILRDHPRIADAAVVGVPDDEWGQIAVAVVVPSDPDTPPSLRDLRDHVGAHGDRAMAPRRLRVVTALPRTAMGKVDRGALRSWATRRSDGRG